MRGFLNKNQRQKQIISRLENENKKLSQIIKERDGRIKHLEAKLEQALLCLEELQRFFSRKKKKKEQDNNDQRDKDKDHPDNTNRKKRGPSSYRRPTPPENEVTDYQECRIDNCPDCGTHLIDFNTAVRYEEDVLPLSEWYKALKRVTKRFITTGYCFRCRKRVSATDLPKHTVTLGPHIKQFVTFATIILRLSYDQILDWLAGSVQIRLSSGEVANILAEHAHGLKPEFKQILARIRSQPGSHYDESTWWLQADSKLGGNYAWVMTGTETTDTVFLLGRNRGRGNAEELKGGDYTDQVGITDDYGAYTNLFSPGKHALCWSHPDRKIKDLKNSDHFSKDKKEHCRNVYESFSELYEQVRTIASRPFVKEKRERAKQQLMEKFDEVAAFHINDPPKLKKIKERLQGRKERYFVCITEPGIPPDNNKAERALRHLVLKRKNCYGSKTDKGAEIGSILYSVLLSYWWKSKQNFFREFEKLAA